MVKTQSEEFQQNNLLKSCIGSLVKSENRNKKASPPDLAHPLCPPLLGTFRHDKQEHQDKDIEGDLVTQLTVPEKLRNLNHVIDGL